VLDGHEDDPGPSALALRLMGAVHRLVLRGDAPALAAHYPSAGGEPRDPIAAFRATLRDHAGELRVLVDEPVQTNEPARCAALLGGFLEIARETGLPLRLLELTDVRLTVWPGGAEHRLARAGYHGDPVRWLASEA
jgi:hypothetical protein